MDGLNCYFVGDGEKAVIVFYDIFIMSTHNDTHNKVFINFDLWRIDIFNTPPTPYPQKHLINTAIYVLKNAQRMTYDVNS